MLGSGRPLPPLAVGRSDRWIGYLARIAACHTADLAAFVPWSIGEAVVGRVHRDRVAWLRGHAAFDERLRLRGADLAERSAGLAGLVAGLAARGELRAPTGELYAVTDAFGAPPLALVDRAAVPFLGTRARGVHLNGYVRTADGLALWLAVRSQRKPTYPGCLDNLVAGGWPHGLDARATLRKECGEEAGIPPLLAEHAVEVATFSYLQQDGRSLKCDQLLCFDLELPPDFTPTPIDGEVESFRLVPAAAVAASLRGTDPWKPNCALVAIDFLLRHGALHGELSPASISELRLRLTNSSSPPT